MKDRDERRDTSLPVTGEVGGEGGSYADAVVQTATEQGDVDRADSGGDADISSRPVRRESISADADEDSVEGVVKYPGD
jgi:hypothetical protein